MKLSKKFEISSTESPDSSINHESSTDMVCLHNGHSSDLVSL